MPFLTTEEASDVVRKIAIDRPEMVIGRHPDCEIVIDDGAVSRRHARLTRDGDTFVVEDLQSRNGTQVNNRSIHQPLRLFDGDQITICDRRFVFHIDEVSGLSRPRMTVERAEKKNGDSVQFDNQAVDLSSFISQLEVSSHYSSVDQAFAITPQQRLDAIVDITRTLSKAVGLDQILTSILDCLFRLFVQADRGFVVMRDDLGALVSRAVKVRNPKDDEMIRVSRTIVDYVLEHKQGILSADAGTDQRFELSQSVADFRIRSLMCVPLMDNNGQAMGVIQLDTLRRSIGFDEKDLEILTVVAMQASLAVENESLHEFAMMQRKFRYDLELAHEVQHGLLPRTRPEISGYQFYDYYRPAQQVGGDYYDYIQLNDGRLAVVVADVVGHGVAAALLMAKVAAEVRFAVATTPDAAAAVGRLNRAIGGLELDRFITLVLVMIDPNTDAITIINAGHTQPIIRRHDGSCKEPGTQFSSLPIGIDATLEFRSFRMTLQPGDCIVLYTDGISECVDGQNNEFGVARIRELVGKSKEGSPAEIGASITREVKRFVGEAKQLDDICLVCLGKV